jgi:hypothetical protein
LRRQPGRQDEADRIAARGLDAPDALATSPWLSALVDPERR